METRGPSPDLLSDILGSMNLRGSLYFTTEFSAPWGVRVPRLGNVARFHVVMRGSCWVGVGTRSEPVCLESGDLILIPHGAEHALRDAPGTPALKVDEVVRRSGFKGRGALVFGGPDRGKPTRLLCGHLEFDEDPRHPFFRHLPARIVIRHDEATQHAWIDGLLRSIVGEAGSGRAGREAIVNRLGEVLFIHAVRLWAESSGHASGVLTALADPGIGRCLAAVHGDPGREWNLETLARESGLSRTVFAQRFHHLLDFTPMQYVAFWRMRSARQLLHGGDLTIDQVAGRLGYGSTAAFGRVFKRWVGATPGRYRRGGRR